MKEPSGKMVLFIFQTGSGYTDEHLIFVHFTTCKLYLNEKKKRVGQTIWRCGWLKTVWGVNSTVITFLP